MMARQVNDRRRISCLQIFAGAVLVLTLARLPSTALATDVSTAPDVHERLQTRLEALAQHARPGVFGIAVLDLQSGAEWRVNADRVYPMMSVFKAPLGATVLGRSGSNRPSR